MTDKQRQIDQDNRLLSMIQRHFPSLPLDDRYVDWTKWLGFARAVFETGVTEERDACAKVCDDRANGWNAALPAKDDHYAMCQHGAKNEARALAAAIRERSNADITGLPSEICEGRR